MRIAKQAAVIVGLLSASIGLLFVLLPQLKPEPPPPPEPPPAEQFARLSGLALGGATYGQYLKRTDTDAVGLAEKDLARRVATVFFDIEIAGYSGRWFRIQREVVDAETGDEIAQLSAEAIKPSSNRVAAPRSAFFALPNRSGSFIFVIKLVRDDGVGLACAQSTAFGGLKGEVEAEPPNVCPAS